MSSIFASFVRSLHKVKILAWTINENRGDALVHLGRKRPKSQGLVIPCLLILTNACLPTDWKFYTLIMYKRTLAG